MAWEFGDHLRAMVGRIHPLSQLVAVGGGVLAPVVERGSGPAAEPTGAVAVARSGASNRRPRFMVECSHHHEHRIRTPVTVATTLRDFQAGRGPESLGGLVDPRNTLKLDREDVGQGDAMVLAAGRGSGVVVDTGPDPRPVDRCLRELGITHVPLLVLTHFHADHVRGLPGVLRGREVGAVQTTSLRKPAEQAAFVRRTAAEAHVPVVPAVPGERRRLGPLDWQVLWPAPQVAGAPPYFLTEPNDSSLTLFVRSGALTLLLLGDLEPPAQQGVLRRYPALPRVDVLKVAHHGSAYQDAGLLRTARPRLAVISCGTDNPYGHPAARTVEALTAAGARVLRTDIDGAIAVSGAGDGLRAVGRS